MGNLNCKNSYIGKTKRKKLKGYSKEIEYVQLPQHANIRTINHLCYNHKYISANQVFSDYFNA